MKRSSVICLIISAFGAGGSALLWLSMARLLVEVNTVFIGGIELWPIIILMFCGIIITAASLILASLLLTNRFAIITFSVLTTLPICLSPLDLNMRIFYFFFGLVSVLLLLFLMAREVSWHTHPTLQHIFGHRIGLFVTIVSILIAGQFYIYSQTNSQKLSITVPNSLLDQALNATKPLVKDQVASQQQALLNQAIAALDEQLPMLSQVPTEDKIALLGGTVTQNTRETLLSQGLSSTQIDLLAEQLAQSVQSPELTEALSSGTDAFLNTVIAQLKPELEKSINSLLGQYAHYFPFGISIIAFLSVASLGLFVRYLAIFLAATLIKLLILTKLIGKENTTITVERYKTID